MENVTDALIMAGQVLIFIVALSICISSFSNVRVSIDEAIEQREVIQYAKDNSDIYINFISSRDSGATRIVGVETVVSSMYRSIKEDYVLYILFNNVTFNNFKYKLQVSFSDMDEINLISDGIKINEDAESLNGIKITLHNDEKANRKVNKILKGGLYEIIRGKEFKEYLGEYQEKTDEGVSTENKRTKRIITYVENW